MKDARKKPTQGTFPAVWLVSYSSRDSSIPGTSKHFKDKIIQLGMGSFVCNPRPQEAKADALQVQIQPGQFRDLGRPRLKIMT